MSNVLLCSDNCLYYEELVFGRVHVPLGKLPGLDAKAGIRPLEQAIEDVPWLHGKAMDYISSPKLKLYGQLPLEDMKKVIATQALFKHETSYMIEYSNKDRAWRFRPTPQSGTGARVEYEALPTDDGYYNVGTIHTHPGFSPKASPGDMEVMRKYGGLYMIIGTDRDTGKPDTINCYFAGRYVGLDGAPNAVVIEFAFESLFPGLDIQGDYEPDTEWQKIIAEQSYSHTKDKREEYPSWALPKNLPNAAIPATKSFFDDVPYPAPAQGDGYSPEIEKALIGNLRKCIQQAVDSSNAMEALAGAITEYMDLEQIIWLNDILVEIAQAWDDLEDDDDEYGYEYDEIPGKAQGRGKGYVDGLKVDTWYKEYREAGEFRDEYWTDDDTTKA
jgi:hypothetical protein